MLDKVGRYIMKIIDWGTHEDQSDIENRSVRFTNVIFIILAASSTYSFIAEISLFLRPQELVWDQWSIPITILFSLISLQLNRHGYTIQTRILLLIYLPTTSHIIPIIVQNTPSDYYLGYPIALIFHGFLIQITLPRRLYPKTFWGFLIVNIMLILTFSDFLEYFDDTPEALSALTQNQFYFISGVYFWLVMNLILAFLIYSLNSRIDEIDRQKVLVEMQKDELQVAMKILKERQDQLVHSEKMASLTTLSTGLAHEINNPLNYIQGGYDLIRRYVKEGPTSDKESVETSFSLLSQGIRRITKIIRNLGIITTTREGYSESFNVNELMENCILALNSKMKDRIEVHNNINLIIELTGNPSLLSQVVFQILNNSIDSISDKGMITIDFAQKSQKGILTIKDTGKGIPQENLQKVMDPFFTTKDPDKGIGLGMFIASSIVKDMDGSIEIESEVNVGTTVQLTLPLP